MSLACVLTRAQFGMESPLVRVETHIGGGLPGFTIVGLPETVVKESRERVRAALVSGGHEFPAGRITVNLSPAEFPKEGGRYDLPIALGILAAQGRFPDTALAGTEFYGELSLGGELQSVRGALPAAYRATAAGHRVVLPQANASEAALVTDARVGGAWHLRDVVEHLTGAQPLAFERGAPPDRARGSGPDLADVRGQAHARRALEIAAAGQHSLLMIGPPGAGKSMLATRLPGLLPPLADEEALECAALASLAGVGDDGALEGSVRTGAARSLAVERWGRRPFRAPHHTCSAIALVGGGGVPRPGEISLAHHGVLFLDTVDILSGGATVDINTGDTYLSSSPSGYKPSLHELQRNLLTCISSMFAVLQGCAVDLLGWSRFRSALHSDRTKTMNALPQEAVLRSASGSAPLRGM